MSVSLSVSLSVCVSLCVCLSVSLRVSVCVALGKGSGGFPVALGRFSGRSPEAPAGSPKALRRLSGFRLKLLHNAPSMPY
eukprot:5054967-Alexandrium_andersonii.AAC.1